jgi:flagellin
MAFKIIGNVDANRDLMYLDWNKQKVSHLQEQLSTGLRLVRASDNELDLTIADQAKEVQTGLNKAISNLKQGLAAVREAEHGATQIYNLLLKIKETLTEIADVSDKEARETAIDRIRSYVLQINAIVNQTRYGDTADFDAPSKEKSVSPYNTRYNSNILGKASHVLHYGANSGAVLEIGNSDITASVTSNSAVLNFNTKVTFTIAQYWNQLDTSTATGTVGTATQDKLDVKLASTLTLLTSSGSYEVVDLGSRASLTFRTSSQTVVERSLAQVEVALKAIRKLQTYLGQAEEFLQNLIENQQYKMDQMHEVESQLRDVDYAKAFAEMNKMRVVLQANVAAVAQNNQINQLVTQLMR